MSDMFQQIYDYKYWFFSQSPPRNYPTTEQDFLEFGYTKELFEQYIYLCKHALLDILHIHPISPMQSKRLSDLIEFCISNQLYDNCDNADILVVGSNMQSLWYVNYIYNLSNNLPVDSFRLYVEQCLAWGGDFDAAYMFLIGGLINAADCNEKPILQKSTVISTVDRAEFIYKTEDITKSDLKSLRRTATHTSEQIKSSIQQIEDVISRTDSDPHSTKESVQRNAYEYFLLCKKQECNDHFIEMLTTAINNRRESEPATPNNNHYEPKHKHVVNEADAYYREKSYPISKYNKLPRYFGNYQGGGFSPR